jgi:hypothetical protein
MLCHMTQDQVKRTERSLSGQQPVLAALGTVLAWNVLALGAWMGYAVVTALQEPDWGDLILIASAMMGVGAFFVSLAIAGAAVAVMYRRGQWRQRTFTLEQAIGRGSAAAGIGLAPFVIFALIGVLNNAMQI